MKYYSESTGGFYDEKIHHGNIPDDAVEESRWDVSYEDLLLGQSKGLLIKSKEGAPTLCEQTFPSIDYANQLISGCIATANQQISIIKPAVDGGYAKPEHTKLLTDWQRYRYELTLVPEQPGWPDNPQLPDEPEKVI